MDNGSTSSIPSSQRLGALFLVLAFVAITNQLALEAFQVASTSTHLTLGLAIFYVVDVAFIALFCGHSKDPLWLKYFTLVWIFALVDLQSASALYTRTHLPLAALVAGQIGLLVTILLMGTGHWTRRVFATGVLGFVLFLISGNLVRGTWLVLVTHFAASLAVMLWLLRYLGFRLLKPEPTHDSTNLRSSQFGLRHAMSLTTVLALAMGLLKGQGATLSQSGISFWQSSGIIYIATGIASAIVAELACWAALGGGRDWIRYVTSILITSLLGIAMAGWFTVVHHGLQLRAAGAIFTDSDSIAWRVTKLGWEWIAWFVLSGMMLFASLIFFRAQGLRLLRVSGKD